MWALVLAENGVKCFQSEFLDSAYTVRKLVNVRRIVSLFETTGCLYADW